MNVTLKKGDAIFTSVPPAVALSIFKNSQPDKAVQFASALQDAIYFDGIEPEDLEAYGRIAEGFGFETTEFIEKMNDSKFIKKAEDDFRESANLGVTGFPTVFVEHQGTYHTLARGFIPFDALKRNFLSVQQQLS